MARPQRIELANAFYHVSNNKKSGKPLFPTPDHAATFLEQVQLAGQRFNVELHGWTLGRNQYQLLVKTPEANLSRFMRQVDGLYTLRYQQLQGRRGSVFHTRYKSVLVQPALAEAVLHYLHYQADHNGKLDLGAYGSSLLVYLGQQKLAFPVISDELLGTNGKGERVKRLRDLLQTPPAATIARFFARKSRPALLGDDSFKQGIRTTRSSQPAKPLMVAVAAGSKRPAVRKIVTNVAQAFTVSETSIVQAARGPDSKNIPRWVAMHLCQEVGGVTLQVIAEHFGLQRYGTVSTTIGKLRAELPENPRLQRQVHKLVQELR